MASSSTGPGSKASIDAMGNSLLEHAAYLNDLPHTWAKDMAAAYCRAVDTRTYSQSLDTGIRLALGADDPSGWDVAGSLWRQISAHGPAKFGLRCQPSVDTIGDRLRQWRVSPIEPTTRATPLLHTMRRSDETAPSTTRLSS